MNLLLLLLGALLLALTMLDALWTTIAPRGAGPISGRAARAWWTMALGVHRRFGTHRLLAFSGPMLLVAGLLGWVAGLWGGWLLVFSAEPGTVVTSTDQVPADGWGRAYYIGFVLFTLGTGDYVPVGAPWQLLSAAASLSGLFVVTLAITYILNVVSAVTAKRRLAGSIHSLGTTAEDVVRRAWDGEGFSGLDQHLPSLGSELEHHTQRHLAYPVLHYFHATHPASALGPSVAVFFDALLLLGRGVAPEARPAPAVVEPPRRTTTQFLTTLQDTFIAPSDAPPPPPSLALLRDAGIPVVSDAAFARAVDEHDAYRCLLHGLVIDGGRTWEEVRKHEA